MKNQKNDINQWIFSKINIPVASKILELCCGTGMQTKYLADAAGPDGHIIAVDYSKETMDKMLERISGKTNVATLCCSLDDISSC